ncbi:MAG: hypothetical protein KatS3mg077_3307 [Candidatus Binatia bacterium]|nr:MAG: hypothetical protein KatS3mg077_3307 [Candidatus Binatia bacterium]
MEALESWGFVLDRDDRGELIRRLAGGLSEPRIVSVREQIGPAIMSVLGNQVRRCDLEILEHHLVTGIQPYSGRRFRLELVGPGEASSILEARAVVVCTGRISYWMAQRRSEQTADPPNINHVLFQRMRAMGLPLVQPDYFQYQPFGIVATTQNGVGKAVPESIVNFPVRLLDRYGQDIGDIRLDRLALTERMFALAREGRAVDCGDGKRGFWLTLSELDPEQIARTFPKLHQYLTREKLLGQNVFVYPFLHYFLGGFQITPTCASVIPGLFLAGEITGGLRGQNRPWAMASRIRWFTDTSRVNPPAITWLGRSRGGLDEIARAPARCWDPLAGAAFGKLNPGFCKRTRLRGLFVRRADLRGSGARSDAARTKDHSSLRCCGASSRAPGHS